MSTTGDNETQQPRPAGNPHPWSAADVWAAGWYADPWQPGRERRWTGNAWTSETRGAAGPNIAGLGGPPAGAPMPPPDAAIPGDVAPPPSTTWWTSRRLVALVATLAAIALLLGFTVTYVAADTSSNASKATPPPTDRTSPTQSPSTGPSFGSLPGNGARPPLGLDPNSGSAPGIESPNDGSSGSAGAGSGSPNGAQSSDPSANVLRQLVVRQSDVTQPNSVALSDSGDSVTGTPTLDLCNGTYPSESLRTARLQVDETGGSGTPVFSTEAVLYRDAAATSQAFSELRSVVAHCPPTAVSSPVGEPPVTTKFNAAPDTAWPQVAGVERQAYDFTMTDSSGASSRGVAVYLRRGRALLGLYFKTPPDAAQPSVGGKTTVPSIVSLFAQRLASVPASTIGA